MTSKYSSAQYELVRKAHPTSIHFEWHTIGETHLVPMVEVAVYGHRYVEAKLDVKMTYYSGGGDQEYARAMAAALLDASATMDAIYQVWAETAAEYEILA